MKTTLFLTSYFNKLFVILPNLNPKQINSCIKAIENNHSFDYCYKFRNNINGINLNADYPTLNFLEEDGLPLQAQQTEIIISLNKEYNFNLMLDFHSNGKSHKNIYKYDEIVGEALAKEMNKINAVVARDYVNHKNKGITLSGTSGAYFGKERKVPIITIEFGARKKITTQFEQHCKELWLLHKPAFDYLLRKNDY